MRPTIALCCILKDELKNLPQLLKSVEGCFDEIYLTDTGSTDESVGYIQSQQKEWLETGKNICNTPIFLDHFKWVDDFAQARNYSMKVIDDKSQIKTDYVMWMDLDDVMSDKEKFKQWRDHVMMLSDFWLAPYHYSFDGDKPTCTFLREREIGRAHV